MRFRESTQRHRNGGGWAPAVAGLTVLACSLSFCSELGAQVDVEPQQRSRPNLVLFLVDDLGWQDTSLPMGQAPDEDLPSPLNLRYKTPNLRKLAARGIRFSRSYASAPVCTPTRASIMTGQSPARTHITYWTLHRDRDTSRPHPEIQAPAWRWNGLGEKDVTLPAILKKQGYRTIHVGKAHFGAHNTFAADPCNIGFDINVAGHASGAPASYYAKHQFSRAGRTGNAGVSVWDVPGLDKHHGGDAFLTEVLIEEALPHVRDSVATGVPFYLNFCPYAVHTPIMKNPRYESGYPELDEVERAYATMVESVDTALGRLLELLDELEVTHNTWIVFSSDNGGLSAHARGKSPSGTAHTHNAPLRSGKGSCYEGGTRVVTVVAGPGLSTAAFEKRHHFVCDTHGVRCDVPIVSHDFFATMAAWGRAEIPRDWKVDGVALQPLLKGEVPTALVSRILGWNQPHQWGAEGPGIWPFTAICRGHDKLIYDHARRRFELFDLGVDIGESTELTQLHPERTRELARLMQEWIEDTGAQLSIDRNTQEPIEGPLAAATLLFPETDSKED